MNPPRIYLHIGRNKAGSTSLQDFFVAHHDHFAAVGTRYCLFGNRKDTVPGLLGFATPIELAEHIRTREERTYLISNEYLFGWPQDFTRGLVAYLNDFDLRVIAYVRPYGAWVLSTYSEVVKRGEVGRDFDTYFEDFRPRISAWQYLEGWGDALGWDRLRIRSLNPLDLFGGDLIADCLSALDLDPALAAGAPRSNCTPHWTVLELSRELVEREEETGWDDATRRIAEPLQVLMEDCLTRHNVRTEAYLTAKQAGWLADLYNHDIARIAEHTDVMLQPEQPDLQGRKMLPSFQHIPRVLLRELAALASEPTFRVAHPEAAKAAARLAAEHGRKFRMKRLRELLGYSV